MTVVQVRDGDPVEKALRKFRRKVEQAGIRKEVRKREYYLKPGEQRRKKEREAQRRRFKAIKAPNRVRASVRVPSDVKSGATFHSKRCASVSMRPFFI